MQFERVCPTCLLLLLQTLLNSPTQSWFGGAFNYYRVTKVLGDTDFVELKMRFAP